MIATRALFALVLVAVPMHVGSDESPRAGEFDVLFQKHAAAHGVDWRLLKAVAIVESHLNSRAVNRRDPSIGLMGVLCRPQGDTCGNRFDVAGWPPRSREQLFDPDFNIAIGAQVLAWNLRAFGTARGIAVYNMWDARLTPRGRAFPNQFYVDKVLARYRELTERMPKPVEGQITGSTGRALLRITKPPHGDRAGSPTIRANPPEVTQ